MTKTPALSTSRTRAVRLLAAGAATALTLTVSPASLSASAAAPVETTDTTVTVRRGTNVAATMSPDAETVVMDLHGILYAVPVAGGTAQPLTDPLLEAARPAWSPDGSAVAVQAYAGGNFHIWTMAPDGSGLSQLTNGPFDDREPRWSPDGGTIAFSSDRDGSYDIWTVDVATGALRQWTDSPAEEYEPAWSPGGDRIAYVVDQNTIMASAASGDPETLIDAGGATVDSPAWSPDGERLAYVRREGLDSELMVDDRPVTTDEDVFPFYPEWLSGDRLLYTADGRIKTTSLSAGTEQVIPFEARLPVQRARYEKKDFDFDDRSSHPVKGIVSPQLAPDGDEVAFIALNDVWRMPIGGTPRRVTDDSFYEVDVAWSPDGTRLAYTSDKAGTPDLYIRDLRGGSEQRVTDLPGAEVSAAWSPDGGRLAFQNQNDTTFVVEIASGDVRQVHGELFEPGRPTWSADGETIALAALKPYSTRFREGTSQILTVDLDDLEARYTPPVPQDRHASIATRGDDGPVWSPDGRWMAFVVESLLWVVPVDAHGQPTGAARPITREATDSPTWSGDSQSLLYLHNGQLRLVDRDGTDVRDDPVDLQWQRESSDQRYTIHAGRLWDGRRARVQENVDVTVVGNRITRVAPHRDTAHEGRVIDASDQTLMPGLIDMHVHQENRVKFFGDRQGRLSLSYGITTTHSVGDPVYRAIEDRESLTSGQRIGPRFFATGEALDGSRIYYNFMRPVRSASQLPLEFSRAEELDYDMLKTYVRLPATLMGPATDFAHKLGITARSHYLAPGMYVGQDGTTHLAATQRLGYARTQSAEARTYNDIIKLYARGNKSIMTTFFFSSLLLAEDPSLAHDRRASVLYPEWEAQELRDDLASARDPNPDFVKRLRREVHTFVDIYRSGGRVLTGTDTPLAKLGVSTQLNLRALVKYGLTPHEALRTATVLPARSLGLENELGAIEEGMLADMIVVDGNPLEDIADAAKVRRVVHDGRIHTRSALIGPFADGGARDNQ